VWIAVSSLSDMLGGVLERGFDMRKSVIETAAAAAGSTDESWLDLEAMARVEISSEDVNLRIEDALGKTATMGWRAGGTGPQVVRLVFDAPQKIRRIQVRFVEKAAERGQEFAVYAGAGAELREVVRQQWTFSPHGATEELEDYTVDLNGVTTLELRIDPDRSHDPKMSQHYASLQSLKLA
jgi:hypothetical protein